MTLDELKSQLKLIVQPTFFQRMFWWLLPGGAAVLDQMSGGVDRKEAKRWIAMIDSMTLTERRSPEMIDSGRRNRIARGSGSRVQAVSVLVKQFARRPPS